MNRKPIRVGFTGLTGMIGRNFLDLYGCEPLLRERFSLVAFSRAAQLPEALRGAGVECRRVDYTDVNSFGGRLEDLDVFVHFAGTVRAVRPADYYAGNSTATAVVVDAASRFGGRLQQLIYASSMAAGGPSPAPEAPRQEHWAPEPVSHYGRSKLLAEQEVRSSAVDWTILRLAGVYGPYDRDGLLILRAARRGILPTLGRGPHLMSYVFAQDLARLLAGMILEERVYRGVFNVCYDRPVELVEYCERARAAMGLPPHVRELPLPRATGYPVMALLAAARRLSGRPSIRNPDKVRELMEGQWIQDNGRLRHALGVAELRERGALAETVAWCRRNGLL